MEWSEANPDPCSNLGLFQESMNSTEGGFVEVVFLYVSVPVVRQPRFIPHSLRDVMKRQMLPHSVCPYKWHAAEAMECDGRTQTVMEKNPLSFTIEDYRLLYNLRASVCVH